MFCLSLLGAIAIGVFCQPQHHSHFAQQRVYMEQAPAYYMEPAPQYGNSSQVLREQSYGQVGHPRRDPYTGNCTRSVAGGYGYIGC